VVTADATVAGSEVTETVHQGLAARELLPGEHVVDAGCVTAAHIVTARDAHRIELPGPVGADTVHGRPEAGHIPQSAFHVDWDTFHRPRWRVLQRPRVRTVWARVASMPALIA
jgi:hypothetical protein